MKSSVVLAIAAVLGIGIGVGTTLMEGTSHRELFLPADHAAYHEQVRNTAQAKSASDTPQKAPKLEFVNGSVHDFGSVDRFSRESHDFLIKNVGEAPLELNVKRTTCQCTTGGIEKDRLMPGETTKISVEWEGELAEESSDFKQRAEIETNDPENPLVSLVITGYISEPIRVSPPRIALGRVPCNEGATAEFRVLASEAERIDVLDIDYSDADSAELYEIAFEALPEEEVRKEKGMGCGLLAKLTVKSGLSPGPINQTIRLKLRGAKESDIYVHVQGQAVGDILIASSKLFEARTNLLDFGALKRTESAKAELQVFVTGEYRQETTLSVGEVDPAEYLKVNIGPPQELNKGATIRYKVTIEIPPGMRRINRASQVGEYGKLGRVVLETTHPITKRIPIKVSFSID